MMDFKEIRNGDGCIAWNVFKRLAVNVFPEKAKAFDGRDIGGNLHALGIAGVELPVANGAKIAVISPIIRTSEEFNKVASAIVRGFDLVSVPGAGSFAGKRESGVASEGECFCGDHERSQL